VPDSQSTRRGETLCGYAAGPLTVHTSGGDVDTYTIELSLTSKFPCEDFDGTTNGFGVTLRKGSATLVITGVEATSPDAAREEVWVVANRLLSEMSFYRRFNSEIDPAHYLWRTTTSQGEMAGLGICDGVQCSAHHDIFPASARQGHIAAMDYWRKAELARDDLEKFRYHFLAAENAVSILLGRAPRQGKSGKETEKEWFCEGVRRAFGADSETLVTEANRHTGRRFQHLNEVVEQFLYTEERCGLMHSKEWTPAGRRQTKLPPFDHEALQQVRSALPVVRLVAKRLINAAITSSVSDSCQDTWKN